MEPFDFKPQKEDINLNIASFIKNDFSQSTVAVDIPDEIQIVNPELFFNENVIRKTPEKKYMQFDVDTSTDERIEMKEIPKTREKKAK